MTIRHLTHWLFALAVIGVLLLAISSCENSYDGFTWYRTAREPLKPVWYAAGVQGVWTECARRGLPSHPLQGDAVVACADVFSQSARGLCVIYADGPREEQPGWVIAHEEKHCAGFDHA